jgi:hypothetical protein
VEPKVGPKRKPGPPKGVRVGGRQKGTPNKVNAALKDMILNALNTAGGEAYLVAQAHDNPGPFMTLVGKVLPMQVTGADGGPISCTWAMSPEQGTSDPSGK